MGMLHAPPAKLLPCLLLTLSGPVAHAQLSAWLDFNGAIKGEATEERHKDWIEIQSFSVGVARPLSGGGGGGGGVVRPQVSELTLNKLLDRASPRLFLEACTGMLPYPTVTLDLNAGSSETGALLLARLELKNVLIAAHSTNGSAGATKPLESVSLNFEKIIFTYFAPDGSSTYAGYDLKSNTPSSGASGGDLDGDGMPDTWERAYGLDTGGNDANGDLDGDGLSNLHEYQLGTRPDSGTSFFRAELAPDPVTPGIYQLTWNSVAGKTYVIEWSPDLVTPFTTLRSVTAAEAITTETVPRAGATGFFRVRPQS